MLISSLMLFYIFNFVNNKAKRVVIPLWIILLISSLIFYSFVNYVYLIYLMISFFVSYMASLLSQFNLFERNRNDATNSIIITFNPQYISEHSKRRVYENIVTSAAIFINVSILAVLKYYNFFASSVNSILKLSLNTYNFIIPIGISFYTFSLIAYNVDCLKREIRAEKNPFKFLLFVSYFPKVLQGPISSYKRLKEDGLFNEHDFRDTNYLNSFFRIAVGLIKKIAIANVLNLYVNAAYQNLNIYYGGGC